MKPLHLILLSLGLGAVPALAVDHNNLDAGRPLDFDDAEPAAYREQSLEFGAAIAKPTDSKTGLEGSMEYLYGFAPNTHLSVDFDPRYAADSGGSRRFDFGDIGLGVFHNFNREYGGKPALSLRADASLPTSRDSSGVDFRLRAIASRHFRQYDRVHLNLDLNLDRGDGARRTQPGIILGYSHPLGYPTNFTRTLVAQVAYRADPESGESPLLNLGLGLRQQVSVRSVVDLGLKSDIAGGHNGESLKLVAGYSTQF